MSDSLTLKDFFPFHRLWCGNIGERRSPFQVGATEAFVAAWETRHCWRRIKGQNIGTDSTLVCQWWRNSKKERAPATTATTATTTLTTTVIHNCEWCWTRLNAARKTIIKKMLMCSMCSCPTYCIKHGCFLSFVEKLDICLLRLTFCLCRPKIEIIWKFDLLASFFVLYCITLYLYCI